MTRPIAVLGLGGVGGVLAACTGAIAVGTARTVEAIGAQGLTVVHAGLTSVTRLEAVEWLETPVSLLVIAVKAPALDEALERIAPAAIEDTVVLPLLNGLEHVGRIRDRLGTQVAAGSIGRFEAFSPEPGFVVQRSAGAAIRAASAELGPVELERRLAPLRVDGIEVVVAADEPEVLWEKAARLAVLAAATAASGSPVGVLRSDPTWRARLVGGIEEACAVAAADRVELAPTGQLAIIDAMPAELTTSTARDVAAGRPSELDAITGSVVRAGVRLGVPTPVLAELLREAAAR